MDLGETTRTRELRQRLEVFMDEHIYPNEARFFRESMELGPWAVWPVVEELKPMARAAGLWNLFLPDTDHGAGLTNPEYAPLCEVMGRSHLAPGDAPVCRRFVHPLLGGQRWRRHGVLRGRAVSNLLQPPLGATQESVRGSGVVEGSSEIISPTETSNLENHMEEIIHVPLYQSIFT
jgi:hypothetical protein